MNSYNRSQIIKLDIVYKLVVLAVGYPVVYFLIKLGLKFGNIEYLTNEYIFKFIKRPSTIIIAALILMMLSLALSLEQYFIIAGCEKLKDSRIRVSYMTDNGIVSLVNSIRTSGILPVIFTGITTLTMNMAMVYNIIFNTINIKTYISYGVKRNIWLGLLIVAVMIIFVAVTAVGFFVPVIMYDIKLRFYEALRISFHIFVKNPIRIILTIIFYNLSAVAVIMVLYALISAIVVAGVDIFGVNHAGAAIYLTVMRHFTGIMNIIMCLVAPPAGYAFIFYTYRRLNGETAGSRILVERHYPWMIRFVVIVSLLLDCIYIYMTFSGNYFRQTDILEFAEITAHRGSSAALPENTMAAFSKAADDFADFIELDVRQTKDGGFVIMHDENLKRTTGINEIVGKMTLSQVCSLDAGSYLSEEYSDEKVPALTQVLELATDRRIRLNIELKTAKTDHNYAEKFYALLEEYGMTDKCVITSTDYSILKRLKEIDENLTTGYILSIAMGNYYDMEAVDFFSVNYKFVTSTMIYILHSRGKQIHVWTLDDRADIEKFAGMGADNIITDNPILAREAVYSNAAPDIIMGMLDYVFGN